MKLVIEKHGSHLLDFNAATCSCLGSCIVFMPRIDLWAVETSYEDECHSPATKADLSEESSFSEQRDVDGGSSAESAEPEVPILKASHLWCSFIEQVESICVSTSLMILVRLSIIFYVHVQVYVVLVKFLHMCIVLYLLNLERECILLKIASCYSTLPFRPGYLKSAFES